MKFIPILCSLLFTCAVSAQEYKKLDQPETCKQALQKKHEDLRTLKADFEEISYNSMLNDQQKSSGIFYFKQNGKIRWENQSPQKRAILINEKNVKLYEDGQEIKNATTKMVVKRVQDLMVKLISGDFLNEADFNISYYENKTNYKLILIPKQARLKKYVQKMELVFNKSTLLLNDLSLFSSDSDKVVYKFTNAKANTSISDTVFTKL